MTPPEPSNGRPALRDISKVPTRNRSCRTAFIAYQLFVAITATPFFISRIFLTPGIDRALLASYDFSG